MEEIRLLLDDTAAVIEASYLNWNWLKLVGRTQERSTTRTPAAKLIRSTGTRHARKRSEDEHMKQEASVGTAPQIPLSS